MNEAQHINLVGDDLGDDVFDDVSTLEILRDRVAKTQAKDDPVWPVPRRDGIKVRYALNLTPAKMSKMLRQCTDRRTNVLDSDMYSSMILAMQCTGIFVDDQLVQADGRTLTLHDKAVIEMFGAARAVDAVRRCYGATEEEPDGYGLDVQNHANALLRACGFGEGLDEEDDEEDPPDR